MTERELGYREKLSGYLVEVKKLRHWNLKFCCFWNFIIVWRNQWTFPGGSEVQEKSPPKLQSPLKFTLMSLSSRFSSSYPQLRDTEERGLFLIQLLNECASSVAHGSVENANISLERISLIASPEGDSLQRIAAYFIEALADRMLKGWPGLYKALHFTKKSSVTEALFVQKLFFEVCPFLKLAYAVTNQAIVEAMEGEKVVHIIDLNSCEPAQWIDLIHTLNARPEGPPHLKITGIYEQKEVLDQMAARLIEEAEKLEMPFQFHRIVCKLENLDLESLPVKTGEAVAVSSVLQLHSLLATDDESPRSNFYPAYMTPNANHMQRYLHMNQNQRTLGKWLEKESVPVYNPSPDSALSPLSLAATPKMGSFLNALWGLSPKLLVITEQESDHNGFSLMERVKESLYFYATLFDCLACKVSEAPLERQKVEKMLFAEEIKNIVACEGTERKERHEKLEKWILRLEVAGFGTVPLSYSAMLLANELLWSYGFGYEIKEENGCLLICWHSKPLFSVSAWRYRRHD